MNRTTSDEIAAKGIKNLFFSTSTLPVTLFTSPPINGSTYAANASTTMKSATKSVALVDLNASESNATTDPVQPYS
jgi:hypothetical protein